MVNGIETASSRSAPAASAHRPDEGLQPRAHGVRQQPGHLDHADAGQHAGQPRGGQEEALEPRIAGERHRHDQHPPGQRRLRRDRGSGDHARGTSRSPPPRGRRPGPAGPGGRPRGAAPRGTGCCRDARCRTWRARRPGTAGRSRPTAARTTEPESRPGRAGSAARVCGRGSAPPQPDGVEEDERPRLGADQRRRRGRGRTPPSSARPDGGRPPTERRPRASAPRCRGTCSRTTPA